MLTVLEHNKPAPLLEIREVGYDAKYLPAGEFSRDVVPLAQNDLIADLELPIVVPDLESLVAEPSDLEKRRPTFKLVRHTGISFSGSFSTTIFFDISFPPEFRIHY